MCACSSCAVICISCRKRASVSSDTASSRNNLMATSRPSTRSAARYTTAYPPRPISWVTSYRSTSTNGGDSGMRVRSGIRAVVHEYLARRAHGRSLPTSSARSSRSCRERAGIIVAPSMVELEGMTIDMPKSYQLRNTSAADIRVGPGKGRNGPLMVRQRIRLNRSSSATSSYRKSS